MANRSRLSVLTCARDAQRVHPGAGRGRRRAAAGPAGAAGRSRGSPAQPAHRRARRRCSPRRVVRPAAASPTSRGPDRDAVAARSPPARWAPHVGAVVTDLATGSVLFARAATTRLDARLHRQAGHRGRRAERARPRPRASPRSWPRPRHRLDRAGRRRRSRPWRRAAARRGLPAARHAGSAGRADRPALRAHGPAVGAARLRHLAVHRPALRPGWPPSYITTGNVTPITALEVDQGRLTPAGKPQDADDPGNFRPRSLTPAGDAAAPSPAAARARHHASPGQVAAAPPRRRARATVASVRSPPLAAIVQLDAAREQQRDRGEPGPAGGDRAPAGRPRSAARPRR